MNEKGRVLDILQDDRSFGRDIGRQLNDLGGQVLDIGDIGLEILFLGASSSCSRTTCALK